MKKTLPFATVLALLSGCIVYQMDKTPPCDGLSDAVRAECKFKPRCLLKCEMKVANQKSSFHRETPIFYCGTRGDELVEPLRAAVFETTQDSGLFSGCKRIDDVQLSPDDVCISVACNFSKETNFLSGLISIFTLMLWPGNFEDYYFGFEINVVRSGGLERQYRFKEVIRGRAGVLALVGGAFVDAVPSDVFAAMNRKIVNQLLVKMQQDGFFSAEGRDKAAAAKADVVEAAKKTVAARRKELEDLKKAGIIDEAEYAAEVKKLEGAGK